MPIMDEDDVRICTDNTVKALGWPPFYVQLGAAQTILPAPAK
jgi:hypothetical protein